MENFNFLEYENARINIVRKKNGHQTFYLYTYKINLSIGVHVV